MLTLIRIMRHEGFPYMAYLEGSTALQQAMQFVDDQLLHPES